MVVSKCGMCITGECFRCKCDRENERRGHRRLHGPGAMAKVAETQAEVDRRAKAMAGPWTAERVLEALRAATGLLVHDRCLSAFGEASGVAYEAWRTTKHGGHSHVVSGCRAFGNNELSAMAAALNASAVVDRPSVDEPLPGVTRTTRPDLLAGKSVDEASLRQWEGMVVAGAVAIVKAKADPYVAARIKRLDEASNRVGVVRVSATLGEATKRARSCLKIARKAERISLDEAAGHADEARGIEAALAECGDREAT